jgi:sortase B
MKNDIKNKILELLIFVFVINFIVAIVYFSDYYYKLYKNKAIYNNIRQVAVKNEPSPTLGLVQLPSLQAVWTEPKEESEALEQVSEASRFSVDYEELKKINQDIYAWISIPNTEINYPVLQHAEEDHYYLNHNIDKQRGYPGCIYSEKSNKKDFSDPVTILYGHSMKDGTMFGALYDYENSDFLNKNRYIYIYGLEQTLTYEIIMASEYDNRHILTSFNFTKEEEIVSFISSVSNNNKTFTAELERGLNNQLLVLSTCAKNDSSKRYMVIAKKYSK